VNSEQEPDGLHDALIDHFASKTKSEISGMKPLLDFCTGATFLLAANTAASYFLKSCMTKCTPGNAIGLALALVLWFALAFPIFAAIQYAIIQAAIRFQKWIGLTPLDDEPRILLRAVTTAFVYTIIYSVIFHFSSILPQMVASGMK